MLYSLAIVLALAMVLCMIPAAFADDISITNKSYDLRIMSWQGTSTEALLGKKDGANTVSAEYNYEKQKDDTTGQFTEDRKMAVLVIDGWDEKLDNATNIKVYVDGKRVESNRLADYVNRVGWIDTGFGSGDATVPNNSVIVPIELTKAGYTDTYYIEVVGENGDDTITQIAEISVRLENTAAYKNARTAFIQKISSESEDLDAYIVGDKIYLDFVGDADKYEEDTKNNNDAWYREKIKITFADDDRDLFDVVTWAYDATATDSDMVYFRPDGGRLVTNDDDSAAYGKKLDDDSAVVFQIRNKVATNEPTVSFVVETETAIYETKDYDVVVRSNIQEADPKGIYFAETEKTIGIGESYTPVVMGVATGKKVDATILPGGRTDQQIIDVTDGETVIGTQEGVAYITAKYAPAISENYNGAEGVVYKSNSMKIIVTAKGATDDDDKDGKTYMVTASSLRVRSGAGTNFSQIGSLKNGATVKVESIANGWAKLENGGYVSAQYLAEVVDNGEAQTMYVTARTLNVRKGPGTSYAKVGTLSRGTAVQVVGFSGNWAKLSNGYYVSTSYLAK